MATAGSPVKIFRYEEFSPISTNLDPFSDLVTWLEYYSASDYVISLLTTRHGLTSTEARQRARLITPHARLARDYIDQSMSGPGDVGFLPSYYAILNLLKICILFGPHHASLPANRWHGASYDTYGKDSQSLLTDRITLKGRGALPLFYQTITGTTSPADFSLPLSEVYPYILDVSAEYELASGEPSKFAQLDFQVVKSGANQHLRVIVNLIGGTSSPLPKTNQLKVLVGFKKEAGVVTAFVSKPIAGNLPAQLRAHLRPFLIYQLLDGTTFTRISGAHFLMPEEFPIALAFFHMSSVVRYRPEFLAKLKDSRYWPVLSILRRHALFKFLITFWGFTHRKTLLLQA